MTSILPGRREGQTITLVADTHAGKAAASSGQTWFPTDDLHRLAGTDLDYLASISSAVGIAGDLIDWRYDTPEDPKFLDFFKARTEQSKYVIASGNHDLARARSPYQHRTGAEWAAAIGVPLHDAKPAGNAATDGVQIVAVSQDEQRFDQWIEPGRAATDSRPEVKPGRGFALTDNPQNPRDTSTGLGYLRSRLATGRPTWIMSHYPLLEHLPGDVDRATNDALVDIITSHDNVIGVLSGHRHANPFFDERHVAEVPLTKNGRTVMTAGINGPAAGGQMSRSSGPEVNYPFSSPLIATVLTYSPGKVTVRWRDLISRRWLRVVGGVTVRELSVSCTAPARPGG